MNLKNKIVGTGSFLPNKVLTNDDLSALMDTSDEWIRKRTGILERHVVEDGEYTSDLAYNASIDALKNANLAASDIDIIIVATVTPDKTFPSTASILQHKLKNRTAVSFDISAACSGFIYAMTLADSLMKTNNKFKTALIVGAESFSKILDYNDRSTAILFGDGAGAVILQNSSDESGISYSEISTDAEYTDILNTSGGVATTQSAGFVTMNGREVFRLGIEKMGQIIQNIIDIEGTFDWIVPHQANIRIIKSIAENLNIPIEKFLITLDKHANTSAASIPLTLDNFIKNKTIHKKDKIIFTAVGGGLTWGGLSLVY